MSSSHIFHFAFASPHSDSDRYKNIKLQSMWQQASDLQKSDSVDPPLCPPHTLVQKERGVSHLHVVLHRPRQRSGRPSCFMIGKGLILWSKHRIVLVYTRAGELFWMSIINMSAGGERGMLNKYQRVIQPAMMFELLSAVCKVPDWLLLRILFIHELFEAIMMMYRHK